MVLLKVSQRTFVTTVERFLQPNCPSHDLINNVQAPKEYLCRFINVIYDKHSR